MRGRWGALLALVFGVAAFAPLSAQGRPVLSDVPDTLMLVPVGAFSSPTYVTAPAGDQHRLFVIQQGGLIKIVQDGTILATPFLDASSWISFGGERGLFSLAFAPDYDTSGLFYIYYTDPSGNIRVDEVQRSAADPNVADPTTRRLVITVPHPGQSNHNGGQLQFGPDGMLYMATGDGGGGGDPFRTGQNLQDRRGKLMRIDPRFVDAQHPYGIPPNNPFTRTQNAFPEIWSYGLRNPWRFSFDRTTGDLVIGDVGQNLWEEIDYRPVGLGWGDGANFGWSCFEGMHTYLPNFTEAPCRSAVPGRFVQPVFEYPHSGGHSGCSITGGYVVRDPELTTIAGRYIYSDLCNGQIYTQSVQVPRSTDDQLTGLSISTPVSFGEDGCGHLYAVGQGSGNNVFRVRQVDPPPPDCAEKFPLPVLHADVGLNDDFVIHMYDPDGQLLDGGTLPEGSYRVELDDYSEFHNFHLTGPVSCVPVSSCMTDVDLTGHETWTVNFTPGTVVYQCDPHFGVMFGTFTVTGVGPQPGQSR